MKEYLDFTDLSLFRHYGLSSIPPTLGPALWQVGIAALLIPFVFVHGQYPILGFVNTPPTTRCPFLRRAAYFWLTITCSRFKSLLRVVPSPPAASAAASPQRRPARPSDRAHIVATSGSAAATWTSSK